MTHVQWPIKNCREAFEPDPTSITHDPNNKMASTACNAGFGIGADNYVVCLPATDRDVRFNG